jgi:chromosomal replication initiator protein
VTQLLNHSDPEQAEEPRDATTLWQAALTQLQLQVTRPNYETFLRDTVGVRLEGDRLVVAAPSDFVTEWLGGRLRPTVLQSLRRLIGDGADVAFEVLGAPGPSAAAQDGPSITLASPLEGAERDYTAPRLNDRYTFGTFVEGESNRLALAACQAAAQHPGQVYNPVFLYGGVGLGKTHLMHAMGHALLNCGKRVIYVTSEQFTNDFVAAIREGRNEEFRSRYRTADLLLIDDIQFIAGKEGTMEEFFHTFNDLHSHGRQIVITSDQPPKKVSGLQDRLISRFEGGLIADIQPPGEETRLAILQQKASGTGRTIPDEVLNFIAERVQDNVRELEGSLNRVVAFADLLGSAITLDLAYRALGAMPDAAPRRRPPSVEEIVDAVSRYYQVRATQLAGKGREKRLAHARQVAMYLLHEDAGRPLTEIGRVLGKRDHTTVLYGCKKVDEARVIDRELRQQLQEIRAALNTAR